MSTVGSVAEVDHPAHYTQHPSGIEAIDVTEHFAFNVGAAVAHLFAAPHRAGDLDVAKAVWYLRREIDRLGAPDLPGIGGQPTVPLRVERRIEAIIAAEPRTPISCALALVLRFATTPVTYYERPRTTDLSLAVEHLQAHLDQVPGPRERGLARADH